MDDVTLASLEAALVATPDNVALLAVVLDACLARDEPDRAAKRLDGLDVERLDARCRILGGRALRRAGRAEEALRFLSDDAPDAQLERARALLALDRRHEGRAVYETAIAASPALEDVDLSRALSTKSREIEVGTDGPKRLRVISNDDTTEDELSRLLDSPQEVVRFEHVGGLDELKKQIEKKIILPFKKPSLFKKFKKRVGGGILLYGPPGCGKTLLARATAGECDASFFNVAISDVLDMYIGESEQKLHALFEKARSRAPAVLFFDEVEALGGRRQYTREGTSSKLVSQFLAEMGSTSSRCGAFTSTNTTAG